MKCLFEGKIYRSNQGWGEYHPNYNYWFDPSGIDTSDGPAILKITNTPKYGKEFGAGQLASVDTYLYGMFEWEYQLPIGRNLWPAIWLTGAESWPPEIDVMEGWSSEKGIHKNKTNYRRLCVFNDIQPRLHYGTSETHKSLAKQYLGMNYTWRCINDVKVINRCKLLWLPEYIAVWYNDKRVFECTNSNVLNEFNKPMMVVMNNAVTKDFIKSDLQTITRDFTIYNFNYTPA